MKIVRYSYTNFAKCDCCGNSEFNLFFFEFPVVSGLCWRHKYCARCALSLIENLDMKVEEKNHE